MSLPRHPQPGSSPRTWAALRVGRGLAAAAALVVLVAGVPWALTRFTTWPITGIPSLDQLRDLPTTAASDEAILALFVVGLWAAWAVFVASVIVEAAGEIRGHDPLHLPAAGPLQRSARTLVASIAMSIGSFSNAQTAAYALPDIPVAAAPDPVADQASQEALEPQTEWTWIDIGDETAWDVAERVYGDGTAAQRLFENNHGTRQADGTTWASPTAPIQAGWRLRVEATTTPTPAATTPAPAAQDTEVTVGPGDHFWGIAETRLTEAWDRIPTDAEITPYWQQLVDANRDRIPPPGDPNLIHPGDHYTLPAPPPDPTSAATPQPAPAPRPPAPEPTTPADPPPPPPSSTSTAPTTSSTSTTPSSSSTTSSIDRGIPAPPTTSSPTIPAPTTSPTTAPAIEDDSTTDDRDVGGRRDIVAIGVTTTLAALFLGGLARRRLSRRRTARPGANPGPRRVEDLQAEQALAAAAGDVADQLLRLNNALTSALAALTQPPKIAGVILEPGGDITVRLSEAIAAPAPFRDSAEPTAWLLHHDDVLEAPEDVLIPVLETLVAVGRTDDGAWILLDLESLGTVGIDGDPAAAQALARSMIQELALQPVGHLLTVTIAGLPEGPALDVVDHGVQEIQGLTDYLVNATITAVQQTAAYLDHEALRSTLEGRVQGLARDSLVASVIVAANADDWILFERLAGETSTGGLGLAAVAVAPLESLGPHTTSLVLDADGAITIPHLNLTARAAGIDVDELRRLEELLRREPDHTPAPSPLATSPVRVVDTSAAEPAADWEPPAWKFCVRVFGDHQVITPAGEGDDAGGEVISFHEEENEKAPHKNTRRGPELISFLTLRHDRAATVDNIREALWWGKEISTDSVAKLLHGTRAVLGGADMLSFALGSANKSYRLSDEVVSDVELLSHALDYASTASRSDPESAVQALVGTLGWIEAPPFQSDHLGKGLASWADGTRVTERIEQTVISAALLAADLLEERGAEGLTTASWAIDQALLVCPTNEALIRRAMELDAARGAHDTAEGRYRALATTLARDEQEPEPDTEAVRERITSRGSRTG